MRPVSMVRWFQRLRLSRATRWFIALAGLLSGTTYAVLTDSGIHPPPTTGTYAYNTFMPGTAGFPAVGGTYVDPVFGSTVKRLTDIGALGNDDDIYSHHFVNADGTLAFHRKLNDASITILSMATAASVYTNQPSGSQRTEIKWDALDPDKYYFYSGASLMRRNLAAQTNTIIKTFPATLEYNGGSVNYQTGDGRYFTVRYGGSNKVWDSQTDTIYTGSVVPLDLNGWVGISPDGKYIVNAAGPASHAPQIEHYSYLIDHVNHSIAATPTQFWGLCGAHADVVSASDGKDYYIGMNCYAGIPGIYRVDISLNQAGRTYQQQLASNQLLVALDWADDGHFSAVSRGPLRDWVFASTESTADPFNGSVSGWTAYKQEILAINVVTLEVRRLTHHRSRSIQLNYYNQPRVTSSWDGSAVMWSSNFNVSSPTGYADLYAILSPIGPAGSSIPAPTNLRVQ